MRTVYPTGTTLYKPEKCWNGYTILWQWDVVKLIDMNGRSVNEWRFGHEADRPGVDRARLLANGNLLVQRGGMMSQDGLIQEYDWEGRLAWEFVPEGKIPHAKLLGPHHDVFRKADGNTLICESAGKRVFEVTPDGEIVWEHVEPTPRAYRYAYDHCPRTAALGRPKEVSVTPPAQLRIVPDEPLDD